MKTYFYTLILFFTCATSFAQMENNQRAKLYFQEAQKWFNQNDYDEALNYIVKAEQTLEGTNGRILNLKIKTLYNQGKFIEAEDMLMLFSSAYEGSVTEDLKNDTYSYFVRIDKAAAAIKENLAEEERIKEEARLEAELAQLAKQKQLDDASKKVTPKTQKTYYTYSKLEEGKPYLVTYRKSMTSSTSEKSYFIFYGDKYIIYTIPSMSTLKKLDKKEVRFSSYDAGGFGKSTISANVKSDYSGKRDVNFKKTVNFSNVFLGGNGDELLWTEGTQYKQFDKRLHYYYYKNTLSADIGMKKTFQEHYYNPYIETGTISKAVDFNLVKDTNLYDNLKSAGVSHKKTTNYNSPLGLEIKLVPSRNQNMLIPTKKITYYLKDEVKKYEQDGSKYKGTLLYYGVKTSTSYYGYIQYRKSYPKANIVDGITGLTNNYILSETYFNSIYKSFDESIGSGKMQYFTNTAYTLAYREISKIAAGTVVTLESMYGSYVEKTAEKDEVFKIVETPAEFKGGQSALISYLSKNLNYPSDERTKGIEGKVYISFLVNKTGGIEDVEVQKGVTEALNKEAVRLITNMPDWVPASQRGTYIKVKQSLAINFKLQ